MGIIYLMVFIGLAAGLACGVAYPMFCNENVYMLLATSFLRPHLRYRMKKASMHKDDAITNKMLDSYLADVGKSAMFFAMAAPFVFYRVYIQGNDVFETTDKQDKPQDSSDFDYKIEDKAVTMLKQINVMKDKQEQLMQPQEEES